MFTTVLWRPFVHCALLTSFWFHSTEIILIFMTSRSGQEVGQWTNGLRKVTDNLGVRYSFWVEVDQRPKNQKYYFWFCFQVCLLKCGFCRRSKKMNITMTPSIGSCLGDVTRSSNEVTRWSRGSAIVLWHLKNNNEHQMYEQLWLNYFFVISL